MAQVQLDDMEMTMLWFASGMAEWTSINGPMSLIARSLAARGLAQTQNDNAPTSVEYRLTTAGSIAFAVNSHQSEESPHA